MNRFKMIVSGYLILIKNKKVLLMRRKNTGYEDGKYGLPAGHVEENESIRYATCREAEEEIGIVVKPHDLIFVHAMHRKENDIRTDIFFTTKHWSGEIINNEPKKCDDLNWFSLGSLPRNIIPYIKQALENFQNSKYYSEKGWYTTTNQDT